MPPFKMVDETAQYQQVWGMVIFPCPDMMLGIGSGNGLLPIRRLAVFSPNAGILFIGPLIGNTFRWNRNQNTKKL